MPRTTARPSGRTTSRSCSSAGEEGQLVSTVVFLFSDTQIVNESFVEDINNILNTGEVPNLFDSNDTDQILVSMRPICQAGGAPLAKASLYSFFVKRVRKNIHISLCLSPMGEPFRTRLRNFPSLGQLLHDRLLRRVARGGAALRRLLRVGHVDMGADAIKAGIVHMCGKIHQSVEVARGATRSSGGSTT